MNPLTLVTIPAFDDNYLWLLHNGVQALVVDPGDFAPVEKKLKELHLTLEAILVTHHHIDHVGGVVQLQAATGAKIYAPRREALLQCHAPITRVDGSHTLNALGCTWQVLEVPGHTTGHIAYFCQESNQSTLNAPLLFCGDTLFSAGCGRLFEGTPAQMLQSLQKLMALPDNTLVCCAHEYTLANLKFARAVESSNNDILTYETQCQAKRQAGQPTLPSTIGLEKKINPFLRTHLAGVQSSALSVDPSAQSEIDIFAALRQWKNNFQ